MIEAVEYATPTQRAEQEAHKARRQRLFGRPAGFSWKRPEPVTMVALPPKDTGFGELNGPVGSHFAEETPRYKVEAVSFDVDETAMRRMISIKEIQRAVCKEFGFSINDLIGIRRHNHVVVPRHIAMVLSKMLTLRSFPEIGRRFGGRDHTTVLHAMRKYAPIIEALKPHVAANKPISELVVLAKDMHTAIVDKLSKRAQTKRYV